MILFSTKIVFRIAEVAFLKTKKNPFDLFY